MIVLGIGTKQELIPFLETASAYIYNRMRIFITYFNIPLSLRIFNDLGIQITNTAVFSKIFIFQK